MIVLHLLGAFFVGSIGLGILGQIFFGLGAAVHTPGLGAKIMLRAFLAGIAVLGLAFSILASGVEAIEDTFPNHWGVPITFSILWLLTFILPAIIRRGITTNTYEDPTPTIQHTSNGDFLLETYDGIDVYFHSPGCADRDETGFRLALREAHYLRENDLPLTDEALIAAYIRGYDIAHTVGHDNRDYNLPNPHHRQNLAERVRTLIFT